MSTATKEEWSDIYKRLSAPFPPEAIEFRIGNSNRAKTGGTVLFYLTARDVMDRLDEVVGPGNWSTSTRWDGPGCLCTLTILGVSHEDGEEPSDIEGYKGAISGALKRAAVRFGVGRYLYAAPTVWINGTERSGRFVPDKGWQEEAKAAYLRWMGQRPASTPQPRQEPRKREPEHKSMPKPEGPSWASEKVPWRKPREGDDGKEYHWTGLSWLDLISLPGSDPRVDFLGWYVGQPIKDDKFRASTERDQPRARWVLQQRMELNQSREVGPGDNSAFAEAEHDAGLYEPPPAGSQHDKDPFQ